MHDLTVASATSFATQSLFGSFTYPDARAAIAWLERAFGTTVHVSYDGPDGLVHHAELQLAGNTFMLGTQRGAPELASVYVVLARPADVDAMVERARSAGATIDREPYDTDYGSHDASIKDLAGHSWLFGTYRPGYSGPTCE